MSRLKCQANKGFKKTNEVELLVNIHLPQGRKYPHQHNFQRNKFTDAMKCIGF